MIRVALLVAMFVVQSPASVSKHSSGCDERRGSRLSKAEFEIVMNDIALGWNQANARRAASCFTSDAIYSSMPRPNMHIGRPELYRWFGGDSGRPRPMQMQWHHLLFDADQQIGVGEYTFRYEAQTHGLVIVKLTNGLVSNWREYEVSSPRSWKELVGANLF